MMWSSADINLAVLGSMFLLILVAGGAAGARSRKRSIMALTCSGTSSWLK